MRQHQRRAEGVGAEDGFQLGEVDLVQALFRHAVRAVQHAGRMEDAVPGPLPRQLLRGLGDGGLVVQVQRRIGAAAQAHGQGAARVGLQMGQQRAADGARGADDQGAIALGERLQGGCCHVVLSVQSSSRRDRRSVACARSASRWGAGIFCSCL